MTTLNISNEAQEMIFGDPTMSELLIDLEAIYGDVEVVETVEEN